MFTINIPYECQARELTHLSELAQIERAPDRYRPWVNFTYLSARPDGAKHMDSLTIAVMGQTGYGKSTLLNALMRTEIFQSDAVRACTRDAQSAQMMFTRQSTTRNRSLSLVDLPGIGESAQADAETHTLYRETLKVAGVILLVLRADKRDHERDLYLYNTFIRPSGLPCVIALNACDKIEPLNRHSRTLSAEQQQNLNKKVNTLSQLLSVPPERIARVSATDHMNTHALFETLISALRR